MLLMLVILGFFLLVRFLFFPQMFHSNTSSSNAYFWFISIQYTRIQIKIVNELWWVVRRIQYTSSCTWLVSLVVVATGIWYASENDDDDDDGDREKEFDTKKNCSHFFHYIFQNQSNSVIRSNHSIHYIHTHTHITHYNTHIVFIYLST